jgi:hypothetical protein
MSSAQSKSCCPENVHPTPGIDGPGVQRIVQGQNGELWFSREPFAQLV